MKTNEINEFFVKFGIPAEWIVKTETEDFEAGEIAVNVNDSNEFPAVNGGDETLFHTSDDSWGDVAISGDTITFRGKSRSTTDFFDAQMVKGDDAGNIARISKAMSEAKDAEGDATW